MKNGVSTDETANSRSAQRAGPVARATSWKAKPAPRSTIPSAARLSGMNSVDMIAAKAAGNAVHSTTSTKISQTWFASQTGPIAQSIRPRGRSAALAAAGEQRPEPGAEVGAAEHGVERDPDPQDRGDGVGLAQPGTSGERSAAAVGPYGTSTLRPSASRQRRDIARRTSTVAMPSTA